MSKLKFTFADLLPIAMSFTGCTSGPSYHWPLPDPKEPPLAFHDTRLQYALVMGENDTLAKDFDMKLPPSMAERIVVGAVLPFTVATEAAFWPFFTGIKALAPSQDYGSSAK